MSAIQLRGLACRAKVGVPTWERRKRQTVTLDLTLSLDLKAAALSDDLKDSVDYGAVEAAVRTAVENGEFKLLERLADAALDAALSVDGRIRGASVAAVKRPSVMPKTEAVAIHLSKSRPT
ncbi:MAG: dihydroneopterin aldolase [Elusimicrobia bacterium]|nr:MAG: dihydroneopterin aldolase [Elusimicrobiota bacterium]